MGAQTAIEWACNPDGTPGATWNPLRARDKQTGKVGTFCVHQSPGCINCYAEVFQGRSLPGNGIGLAYTAQNLERVDFFLDENMLQAPARRRKPSTWFLSSMTDVFAGFVTDAMLDAMFAVMAHNPEQTFIVVTKRADRMREYINGVPARQKSWDCDAGLDFVQWPLRNVWLVVSIEDQRRANERVPQLLATPAAVRGVSCEPLIGPVLLDFMDVENTAPPGFYCINALTGRNTDMARPCPDVPRLDWVIAGGESGPKARPMHPDWARSLRDQCAVTGVPFFYKQWGEYAPSMSDRPDLVVARNGVVDRSLPSKMEGGGPNPLWCAMARVGKKAAGALLDGAEHKARPAFVHLTKAAA